MIYAVNYDLRQPGRNYEGLYTAIKGCGDWLHVLGSTWLVSTRLDANQIWDHLSGQLDANDHLLIHGVTSDHQGWLPKNCWDWINARIYQFS